MGLNWLREKAEHHPRNPIMWLLITTLIILDVALASSVLVQGVYYGALVLAMIHQH
jgi:hypothetical protein